MGISVIESNLEIISGLEDLYTRRKGKSMKFNALNEDQK